MLSKPKIKQWAKEIAITSILLIIAANAVSYFRSPDIQDKSLPLIKATLIDQKKFSSLEYKNKPLLIHFWATWCPTCKLESSNVQTLSEHYNVLTIAVNSGTDIEISTYLKEHDLNYKVINDKEGTLAQQFSVQAYPTSFIYDINNKLIFSEVGYTSTWGLYLRMWWASR